MKSIVKIQSMGLDKLNNAEYSNFMSRFSSLVNKVGTKEEVPETSALGFEVADFLVFEEDRSILTDIVSRSRISLQTEGMGSLDKERDNWVVFLFSVLRTEKESPIATRQQAANTLYKVLNPYMQCYRLPNQQETAQIDGLLVDIKKEENASFVKLLGLEDIITGLEETNGMYAELTQQRTHDQVVSQLEESKVIRNRMGEYYDYMTSVTFANSICHPSETIDTFIKDLNALVDETRMLYNLRIAQAKANKKEEGTEVAK